MKLQIQENKPYVKFVDHTEGPLLLKHKSNGEIILLPAEGCNSTIPGYLKVLVLKQMKENLGLATPYHAERTKLSLRADYDLFVGEINFKQ